ncbi:helix-turn-helix transcriptional regulator [Gluconobacter wancherniae]|uniref:helix-turn-helix transcriptional regulator n=1 Tax=Gluconobacter wancherniae TaxID=1307955 RepID=UPI001B8CAF71|nr:helix-turn-helix transcriptional regulator [Gluconobacter wancherniae]MBS1089327.1 helix-turn-helix domain-containing protein [Gluconobacter wancherniae]
MTVPSDSRRAFGAFLRARREAMTPAEAGLYPMPGRRRTAGLRREEAAQLCGISTTWYTWLEQGRDVSCSSATLSRMAGALRLSAAERAYLFELVCQKDPQTISPVSDVAPASLLALPSLVQSPAYVMDALWHVRAANVAAVRLFGSWIGESGANLLHYVFLDPAARHFLHNWADSAQRVVAEFRADSAHIPNERNLGGFVSSLREASPDFSRIWDTQTVMPKEGGARCFHHFQDGVQHFEQITLISEISTEYRLVTLVAAQANPAATV